MTMEGPSETNWATDNRNPPPPASSARYGLRGPPLFFVTVCASFKPRGTGSSRFLLPRTANQGLDRAERGSTAKQDPAGEPARDRSGVAHDNEPPNKESPAIMTGLPLAASALSL